MVISLLTVLHIQVGIIVTIPDILFLGDDATWEERWSNENYFNNIAINNGKFTFDISGTCSYSSGYQETYTSNVTVDLTGSNPTVTLSNIGNGESYSIQLDRDYY